MNFYLFPVLHVTFCDFLIMYLKQFSSGGQKGMTDHLTLKNHE
jgi:hypothetical protein